MIYKIVEAESVYQLEHKVNALLATASEWIPLGGIVMGAVHVYQTVYTLQNLIKDEQK